MQFVITLSTEEMNKNWPHSMASIMLRIEDALRVEFTPVTDIKVAEAVEPDSLGQVGQLIGPPGWFQALLYAQSVIEGTAGSFSPAEKDKCRQVLHTMYKEINAG